MVRGRAAPIAVPVAQGSGQRIRICPTFTSAGQFWIDVVWDEAVVPDPPAECPLLTFADSGRSLPVAQG